MPSAGAWTATITTNAGVEIILIKVAGKSASSRWLAQKIINAVRARLPLQKMAADIVVVDADSEPPYVFGSSAEAESYARGMISSFQSFRWQSIQLT